jgi:hypothetical protein
MHRQSRIAAVTLVALALLSACTATRRHQPNPAASDKVCDQTGCTSLLRFSQMINTDLSDRVVGYISLVGPHITARGQARTAANPVRCQNPDAWPDLAVC